MSTGEVARPDTGSHHATARTAIASAAAAVAAAKPRLRGVSHVYALFVAVVAGVALVVTAPAGVATFAATVYATTLAGMFGASALYHRGDWPPETARRLLQLDHTAIFLLIAGTYTPIALLAVDGPMRVATLVAVWTIAAAGIGFEWMPIPAPRGYVTGVYMGLGWIGAFAFVPLWEKTGALGVALIAGGGLAYTIGAIVHAARRPDPWPDVFGYHEIFHVFVIVAALMHYCAIAFLVLPLD
jgi:hemolysin III